jgi:peptidoglycan biosynthesis protein MviN/MurJ (putative lipid II flippase)
MVGTTAMVLTMCLNIALNAALIPRYGNMGAAVGTTVSYVIGFSYLAHVAFKMAGAKFPWDGAARALGSALAAAAAVVALRYLLPGLTATSPVHVLLPAIMVAGFLALGLYLLFLGLSRAVREDDVAFVEGMGFFGSRTLSRVVAYLVAMRAAEGSRPSS